MPVIDVESPRDPRVSVSVVAWHVGQGE
jgi:hypothetical protein